MSNNFETLSIHAGQANDAQTGAVTVPIYQTSTFGQLEPGVDKGFNYSRSANPTRKALQDCIAALEGGKFGIAFASGLAAVNACLMTLKTGDHVIACRDLYGGSYRQFTKIFTKFGVEFSFVDTSDLSNIENAIRPSTRLLWLETPSNPLLIPTDIAGSVEKVRGHEITVVVDNTFATPYLQNPLALGADIVLHSTSKYISGHADVIGGALVTNDSDIAEELYFIQNSVGAIPGPQDCFLTIRGLKTLAIRMEKHCSNAEEIAYYLSGHPKVAKVYYPGLKDHKGYAIAKRQQKRAGAMISFELRADVEEARRFASRTHLFTLAESLGSTKSLLCHPPTMTHASVEAEVRREIGITDGLIRLSIGIENIEDLISDLDQAFQEVKTFDNQPTKAHA